MTKYVVMADSHGYAVPDIPAGDVLIHCGDITGRDRLEEYKDFEHWTFPCFHSYKILCPGNHDRVIEHDVKLASLLMPSWKILIDEGTIIDGTKIYSTPYQPFFNSWAFNVFSDAKRRSIFSRIPDDVELLITHVPPFGILDANGRGEHIGDKVLAERISQLKNLKVHVFGHNHGEYGVKEWGCVKYVNASVCNECYDLKNKPTTFEL